MPPTKLQHNARNNEKHKRVNTSRARKRAKRTRRACASLTSESVMTHANHSKSQISAHVRVSRRARNSEQGAKKLSKKRAHPARRARPARSLAHEHSSTHVCATEFCHEHSNARACH